MLIKKSILFIDKGILHGHLLRFVHGYFAMQQGDKPFVLKFYDTAVDGLDAGADVIGYLLAAGMQDEEVRVDITQAFQQICLQTVEAGEELDAAGLVGGGIHFGCQQLGYCQREVIIDAHPLQEGFGPHSDDLALCADLSGGRVQFLSGQNFQVANQVRNVERAEGKALAAGKFIADSDSAPGNQIDVPGLFPFADDAFPGEKYFMRCLTADFVRHMVKDIIKFHSSSLS